MLLLETTELVTCEESKDFFLATLTPLFIKFKYI